jgi:hypothetical protein
VVILIGSGIGVVLVRGVEGFLDGCGDSGFFLDLVCTKPCIPKSERWGKGCPTKETIEQTDFPEQAYRLGKEWADSKSGPCLCFKPGDTFILERNGQRSVISMMKVSICIL